MAKKRKSSFAGKVNKDAQRQKKDAQSYGYLNLPKDVKIFKEPPGGRVSMNFLPYEVTDKNHMDRDKDLEIAVPNSLWYKKPFKVHRQVGVNNDTVVCPSTWGKKCPICEYRAKRMKEGAEYEETKSLKPSLRNLYIVQPVNDKKHDEIPYIWDISQYLFQNLLNEELEEDDGNEIFPDIEDGLLLKIRFDEKKFGKNTYAETSRIDFKERENQLDDDILDDVPNLDKILVESSYDKIEKLFFELDDEDTDNVEKVDDEEEEEKPKRTRKKKQAVKEVDDEEVDDEEVDDEKVDEEEEEKPKRERQRKKVKEDKNKCPFKHQFGIDCDKYVDDCDDCDKWDACMDEQERLEKEEE